MFVIVAGIGTGICVNSGVSDLLMWMPKSWRSDNGQWMAEGIAGIARILVGFALPTGAIQMASKLGQSREEVERLTAAIIELESERR